MALTFTDLARNRFASRDLGGPDVFIDNVRVGATQAYDATGAETTLRDPGPARYDLERQSLTANQATVVINNPLDEGALLVAKEVGYFDGDDLIIVWSTAGEDVFRKAANARAILSLVYRYRGSGVPQDLTGDVNVTIPLKADDAIIDAGGDDERYMTIRGTVRAIGLWWNAATVPVSKLAGVISPSNLRRGTTAEAGITQLATAAEIRAALSGNNPAATIQNKVVSLEQTYLARTDYASHYFNDRVTISNDAPASSAGSDGDIWLEY